MADMQHIDVIIKRHKWGWIGLTQNHQMGINPKTNC